MTDAILTLSANTAAGRFKIMSVLRALGPEVLLNAIGGRLLSFVTESFQTKGRGKWKPLASTTLQLRRNGGDMPLQDTGHYKMSFVSATDGKTYVEVGSNLKTESGIPLAKIHEFGTRPYTIEARKAKVMMARTRLGDWLIFGKKINHPGVPARPVLPERPEAEQMIRETVEGILQVAVEDKDLGQGQ